MPPCVIGEEAVALAALGQAQHIDGHQAFERQRGILHSCRTSAAAITWPMWETSNRPAAARVCRCSFSTPSGILHRHVVAGEGHHAGAELQMQGVQRRVVSGHRSSRDASRSARSAPAQIGTAPMRASSLSPLCPFA